MKSIFTLITFLFCIAVVTPRCQTFTAQTLHSSLTKLLRVQSFEYDMLTKKLFVAKSGEPISKLSESDFSAAMQSVKSWFSAEVGSDFTKLFYSCDMTQDGTIQIDEFPSCLKGFVQESIEIVRTRLLSQIMASLWGHNDFAEWDALEFKLRAAKEFGVNHIRGGFFVAEDSAESTFISSDAFSSGSQDFFEFLGTTISHPDIIPALYTAWSSFDVSSGSVTMSDNALLMGIAHIIEDSFARGHTVRAKMQTNRDWTQPLTCPNNCTGNHGYLRTMQSNGYDQIINGIFLPFDKDGSKSFDLDEINNALPTFIAKVRASEFVSQDKNLVFDYQNIFSGCKAQIAINKEGRISIDQLKTCIQEYFEESLRELEGMIVDLSVKEQWGTKNLATLQKSYSQILTIKNTPTSTYSQELFKKATKGTAVDMPQSQFVFGTTSYFRAVSVKNSDILLYPVPFYSVTVERTNVPSCEFTALISDFDTKARTVIQQKLQDSVVNSVWNVSPAFLYKNCGTYPRIRRSWTTLTMKDRLAPPEFTTIVNAYFHDLGRTPPDDSWASLLFQAWDISGNGYINAIEYSLGFESFYQDSVTLIKDNLGDYIENSLWARDDLATVLKSLSGLITMKDSTYATKLFAQYDANQNKALDSVEYFSAILSFFTAFGKPFTDAKKPTALFESWDVNTDDQINLEEFIAGHKDFGQDTIALLQRLSENLSFQPCQVTCDVLHFKAVQFSGAGAFATDLFNSFAQKSFLDRAAFTRTQKKACEVTKESIDESAMTVIFQAWDTDLDNMLSEKEFVTGFDNHIDMAITKTEDFVIVNGLAPYLFPPSDDEEDYISFFRLKALRGYPGHPANKFYAKELLAANDPKGDGLDSKEFSNALAAFNSEFRIREGGRTIGAGQVTEILSRFAGTGSVGAGQVTEIIMKLADNGSGDNIDLKELTSVLTRTVKAYINQIKATKNSGILHGRWDGNYKDGKTPLYWLPVFYNLQKGGYANFVNPIFTKAADGSLDYETFASVCQTNSITGPIATEVSDCTLGFPLAADSNMDEIITLSEFTNWIKQFTTISIDILQVKAFEEATRGIWTKSSADSIKFAIEKLTSISSQLSSYSNGLFKKSDTKKNNKLDNTEFYVALAQFYQDIKQDDRDKGRADMLFASWNTVADDGLTSGEFLEGLREYIERTLALLKQL